MTANRRLWLKQTSLAIAGLSFAGNGLAFEKSNPVYPGPDKKILLGSNENPYGPSPMARKAMQDAVVLSNRYPWDMTTQLREKIAAKVGLSEDHVMIGAGSSDILGTIAQYTALQKGKIVMTDLTFRIWTRAARQMGVNITFVPITAEKKQDLAKMLSSIDADTKLVYVCNPNNPTGTIVANTELKNFIEEVTKTRIVLLDEAYLEYTNEPSFCSLVSNNKNLIVLKTFSKLYGMAGARIGYALAHPEMITKLVDLQPWAHAGASAVAIAGAMAGLSDEKFVADTFRLNIAARNYTIEELAKLNIYTIPSYTNFIYFSLKNYSKDFLALLNAGNIAGGRIVEEDGKWSRITIGTMDEMKVFIKAVS